MRNTLLWVGIAILVTGIVVLVSADLLTDMTGPSGGRIASLVSMTALLVVLGGGMASSYRGRGGQALKHAAIWLAILAAVALLYTYRAVLGFN